MKHTIRNLLLAVLVLVSLCSGTAFAAEDTKIYQYNAGGNTLEEVFGCSREKVLDVLETHVNDTYYLGTPYKGGDYRNPNGDKYHTYGAKDRYGVAAMNCTGFVWHVLTSAGGSNVKAMGGWPPLLKQYQVDYRTYVNTSDVNELIETIIEDDYILPGDIIWTWDSAIPLSDAGLASKTAPYHHVGIYIGDYYDNVHTANVNWLSVSNSKNRWWHSADYMSGYTTISGNQTSQITPLTPCTAITVIKLSKEGVGSAIYRDVNESAWYYNDVLKVSEAGIVSGYPNRRFGPNDMLTRGQFAAILYRAAGNPAGDYENVFTDVKSGVYYETAVSWGYANDIIAGIGNDKFAPDASITREQLVTLMYRYAQYQGNDVASTGDYTTFADAAQVSGYAQDAMNWAIGNEIIKGDGKGLKPINNITRAECAAIISRYLGL